MDECWLLFSCHTTQWGVLFYYSTHLTGPKTRPVFLRFVKFPCLLMLTILFPFVGPGASRASYVQLCCVRPNVADGFCLLSSSVACGSMCAYHIANIAGKYLSSRASVSIAFNTPAGQYTGLEITRVAVGRGACQIPVRRPHLTMLCLVA